MIDSLKDKNNLIALVGASNNKNKYGNKILLDLLEKNYNVVPINDKEDYIAGLKTYSRVQDLPYHPSIINFVVPPEIGLSITKELVEEGFEVRPIVTGNFAKNEVMKYFACTNHDRLKNSDYVDAHGLFTGCLLYTSDAADE